MVKEWLLIGGPAHGRKVNMDGRTQFRWAGEDGEDYLYVAENFAYGLNVYRLGVCYSEAQVNDADKARMVEQYKPTPIVELALGRRA
jgi:hypothetical protein